MEKTEIVTHLAMHPDPEQFSNIVAKFCHGKDKQDLDITYSSTTIPVNQAGGFTVIPSCIILWKCTKEQKQSYLTQLKLMLHKS
jgi:hypothetical protein